MALAAGASAANVAAGVKEKLPPTFVVCTGADVVPGANEKVFAAGTDVDDDDVNGANEKLLPVLNIAGTEDDDASVKEKLAADVEDTVGAANENLLAVLKVPAGNDDDDWPVVLNVLAATDVVGNDANEKLEAAVFGTANDTLPAALVMPNGTDAAHKQITTAFNQNSSSYLIIIKVSSIHKHMT